MRTSRFLHHIHPCSCKSPLLQRSSPRQPSELTLTYSTRTELTAILASSGPLWFLNNYGRSPMSDEFKLLCWVQGDRLDHGFLVRINPSNTIADLKEAIQAKKPSFQKIDPASLQLWKVGVCRWLESAHRSDPLTVTRVHGKYQRRSCSLY